MPDRSPRSDPAPPYPSVRCDDTPTALRPAGESLWAPVVPEPLAAAVLLAVLSVATLLWRRVNRRHGAESARREYLLLGVVATPLAVAGATVALSTAVRVAGR